MSNYGKKEVRISELFSHMEPHLAPLFEGCEYPWELLPKISGFLQGLLSTPPEGFSLYSDGVLVGKNVKIYSGVTIEPPAIIGSGSELRPGAFIRGNVIVGEGCVVGNSTELKNCLLLSGVQVPHYNYVGDSVLGNHAHMGAGAVCSNLKADGKNVVVHAGDNHYETGLKKMGAVLGDNADVGCGCVLNPGTVVGCRTSVYPLTALRGVYPADSIVKAANAVVERK